MSEKKNQVVHVRMTSKEKRFIEAAAKERDRTVSDYVRILAVGNAKQVLSPSQIAEIALKEL